jgi:hypothetical protein
MNGLLVRSVSRCQSSRLSIPAAGTDCRAELSTFSSFVSKSTNRQNHFKDFRIKNVFRNSQMN